MKKTATLAFASLLALGILSPAYAQYEKPIGLSIRVGVFYPTNSDARDAEGRGWFTGGAEFKIKDLEFGTKQANYSASLTASLDYYGKGSFSNVPLLLNYVGRVDSLYYVGGAGVGFGRVPQATGGSKSDTEFAYRLGIGYDFVKVGTPFFLEVNYFGSSESKLSGFGIYGGIRF